MPFRPTTIIHRTAAISVLATLAACAATPQTVGPHESVVETLLSFSPSGHAEMDAWRSEFASRAIADGFDRDLVFRTLDGIHPLSLYLGANASSSEVSNQAEFAKPIWDYVGSAVTTSRLQTGAEKLVELEPVFANLESRYGVDRQALIAIWAMETNFGGYIGDFDAANTLANMAVEGRRRQFAEGEIYALMKMQQRGLADRDELVSGWAGAMGQTQFMPSTYLAWAADYEGDGHIDVWKNPADALASAANYLSASGYRFGEPWGIEVLAPAGFDWSLADGNDRRIDTWGSYGLSPITGGAFNASGGSYAELCLCGWPSGRWCTWSRGACCSVANTS